PICAGGGMTWQCGCRTCPPAPPAGSWPPERQALPAPSPGIFSDPPGQAGLPGRNCVIYPTVWQKRRYNPQKRSTLLAAERIKRIMLAQHRHIALSIVAGLVAAAGAGIASAQEDPWYSGISSGLI